MIKFVHDPNYELKMEMVVEGEITTEELQRAFVEEELYKYSRYVHSPDRNGPAGSVVITDLQNGNFYVCEMLMEGPVAGYITENENQANMYALDLLRDVAQHRKAELEAIAVREKQRLTTEAAALNAELATLKGFFSRKRRQAIEARLTQISDSSGNSANSQRKNEPITNEPSFF